MKTRPPAVVIGPPRFSRPVFFLPSGSSSVTPSGTFQAMSPVLMFTATRLPQGGRWHNQPFSPPMMLPLPVRGLPSAHWKREVGPTMLLRRKGTRAPSGLFSIHPMLASSFVFTNT